MYTRRLEKGEIIWVIGENGYIWRFRFDPDSQEWVDEKGEVVYGLDRKFVAAALLEYAAAHPDEVEKAKAALVVLGF